MRKRYLLDYAMFAESDNFVGESSASGDVEAITDESPFLEGGTSAEGAEGAAEESAAEEDDDVNVES